MKTNDFKIVAAAKNVLYLFTVFLIYIYYITYRHHNSRHDLWFLLTIFISVGEIKFEIYLFSCSIFLFPLQNNLFHLSTLNRSLFLSLSHSVSFFLSLTPSLSFSLSLRLFLYIYISL